MESSNLRFKNILSVIIFEKAKEKLILHLMKRRGVSGKEAKNTFGVIERMSQCEIRPSVW
jgi:hypothetical protein